MSDAARNTVKLWVKISGHHHLVTALQSKTIFSTADYIEVNRPCGGIPECGGRYPTLAENLVVGSVNDLQSRRARLCRCCREAAEQDSPAVQAAMQEHA